MSKYTTEIRWIVEVNAEASGDTEGMTIPQKIQAAAPNIFNFSFPIWDESNRLKLETMILQHYYMREIGFETVGLWKLQLNTKLNEIMPYYIDLWHTTQLNYDVLEDVNLTEGWTVKRDGTRNEIGKSTTDASGTVIGGTHNSETGENNETFNNIDNTVNSDLPQVLLTGTKDTDYANSQTLKETDGTNTVNSSRTSDGTSQQTSKNDVTVDDTSDMQHEDNEEGGRTRKGLNGSRSYTALVQEYRAALLQIPRMIIDDLSDLFMGLW